MNKTYWVVTANAETKCTAPTARGALNKAMKLAHDCVTLGLKVTVLCNGNIVWVG